MHLFLSLFLCVWAATALEVRLDEGPACLGELECWAKVARNSSCFGEEESIVEAFAEGGMPPYRFLWKATGKPLRNVLFSARGGERVVLTVVDSAERKCEATVHLGPKAALEASIRLERPVSCQGRNDAILNLTVHGGWPPYSYLWSGGGSRFEDVHAYAGHYSVTITDRRGCVLVADQMVSEPPLLIAELVSARVTMHPLGAVVRAIVKGGTPPYEFDLPLSGARSVSKTVRADQKDLVEFRLLGVFTGFNTTLTVTDSNKCQRSVEIAFAKAHEEGADCPDVAQCLAKSSLFPSMYVFCLRKVVAPIIWNPEQEWSCCRASAMSAIVSHLEERSNGSDFGALYAALLLGRALQHCKGDACCGLTLQSTLVPVLERHGTAFSRALEANRGNYTAFMLEAMRMVLLGADSSESPIDNRSPTVFVVGPYGFDNEPVFGPALTLPANETRVVGLILKEFFFPTSSMVLAEFPWTLQVDVDLAAAFVRDAMWAVGAVEWVFPGDSAGVLVLGKLAVHMLDSGMLYETLLRRCHVEYSEP